MNSLDPDEMQGGDNCIYLSFLHKMGSHALFIGAALPRGARGLSAVCDCGIS